jgi:hypothetical protein
LSDRSIGGRRENWLSIFFRTEGNMFMSQTKQKRQAGAGRTRIGIELLHRIEGSVTTVAAVRLSRGIRNGAVDGLGESSRGRLFVAVALLRIFRVR